MGFGVFVFFHVSTLSEVRVNETVTRKCDLLFLTMFYLNQSARIQTLVSVLEFRLKLGYILERICSLICAFLFFAYANNRLADFEVEIR